MSFLDDTPMPPLACSVRACGAPLTRTGRTLVCPARHAFDIAASGYCNLLQPHDRHSLDAGDSRACVAARTRVHERGLLAPLVAELTRLLAVHVSGGRSVLEVGCGPGFALDRIARQLGSAALGLDLSVHAIDAAARRFPALHWVVANADRVLPLSAASVASVVSITGPKNSREFRRVLRSGGRAFVAVPAADDLIELRGAVLGEARESERIERVRAVFAAEFELIEHSTIRTRVRVDAAASRDLLASTYRAVRKREAARACELGELEVTLSTELLVLAPR